MFRVTPPFELKELEALFRHKIFRMLLNKGKRPYVTTVNEIKRDGCFIAYDKGTVLDTSTNLLWAATDNGGNINWTDAIY